MDEDAERFAMLARHVEAIAKPFLVEMFGERCPDFEPGCESCKRWMALDMLLDDPWKGSRRNNAIAQA